MTARRFAFSLAALLLATSTAFTGDLAKVDRTIRREPSYKNSPRYCLLVFGMEARSRVWLVQDGDLLYVDRNGNGDLTEPGKKVAGRVDTPGLRVFSLGDLTDGSLTHEDLSVYQMIPLPSATGKPATQDGSTWSVSVSAERAADDHRVLPRRLAYIAGRDRGGSLVFAVRSQDAPVVHFNGALTLAVRNEGTPFVVGRGGNLTIGVGTPGIGPGTWAFVNYPNTIPTDVHPVAEITFPMVEQKPFRARFELKARC